MTGSEPVEPETGDASADKPADVRKTKGIRLSELSYGRKWVTA